MFPKFETQKELFSFLDDYAFDRKQELNRKNLGEDKGFIKSYVFETSSEEDISHPATIIRNLEDMSWNYEEINGIYYINSHRKRPIGYLESISNRFIMLHSIEKADNIETFIGKSIKDSINIDKMWVAGSFFSVIWEKLIQNHLPNRYVKFKFSHEAKFQVANKEIWEDFEYDIEADELLDSSERRESSLMFSELAYKVENFLNPLQKLHPPFKAIRMLRLPSRNSPGGYEFYKDGKITHRAESFRDGRYQIIEIIRLYEKVTKQIEDIIWLQTEKTKFTNRTNISISGTPVTITFEEPLALETFHNFIKLTFKNHSGPMKIWGNPIYFGPKKVHIYGIDEHLWQKIYLDLSPNRFVIIVPHGTCGNTVHRLITNVQSYLDPGIDAYIGSYSYKKIIEDVLMGNNFYRVH